MLRLLPLLLLSLLMVSCIDQTQKITIKKDGSGTYSITTYMSGSLMALAQKSKGDDSTSSGFNDEMIANLEKNAEQFIEKSGGAFVFEGATPLNDEKSGKSGYEALYSFKDISKVRIPYMGNFDSTFDTSAVESYMWFEKNGKKLKVHLSTEEASKKAEKASKSKSDSEEQDESMKELMKTMLSGLHYSMIIEVEDRFKTNASHVDDNTITIIDLNFKALAELDSNVDVLMSLGDANMALLRPLDAQEGVSIETKNSFDIKFK